MGPTTSSPTTSSPTTSNPTTSSPTTSNPTTGNPTTSDPTKRPTTKTPSKAPTTLFPTVSVSTIQGFAATWCLPTDVESVQVFVSQISFHLAQMFSQFTVDSALITDPEEVARICGVITSNRRLQNATAPPGPPQAQYQAISVHLNVTANT